MRIILFLFLSIFVFLSCDTTDIKDSNDIIISKLKKEWTHSYEEETDSVRIYRPSDYKEFPASRFRQVYSFMDDNKCSYLVLASNDAHYFSQGFWKYNSNTKGLTILDSLNQEIIRYKIIELSDELLKLIQL